MRKIIWTCVAISIAVTLLIAINPPKALLKERALEAAQQGKAVQAAKEAILNEAKVEYLHFDAELADWTIGVFDDGSAQTGYALYICEILREHDAVISGTQIRIVDVARFKAGEDFYATTLGRSACENGNADTH